MVYQHKRVQERRQREHEMNMLDGQQMAFYLVDPYFLFHPLAMRTMAVSARITGYLPVSAILAFVTVKPRTFCCAIFNSLHGFELNSRQVVFLSEGFSMPQENRLDQIIAHDPYIFKSSKGLLIAAGSLCK
jgi:hypothetical protein